MQTFRRSASILLIGLTLSLAACQTAHDRATAVLARGWTENSDDPNPPVLSVTYDSGLWRTADSFLYKPVVDLLNLKLPGCSLAGSGPHGGNPGWDVRQSDSILQGETSKVLDVYDAASAKLLFVHYEFYYPGVYYLVDVNLPELTPAEQAECVRYAEDVLRTAAETSPGS